MSCHITVDVVFMMMYLSDRQRIDTQKVGLYANWPELAALLQQITMFCMVKVYVYIHVVKCHPTSMVKTQSWFK